MTQVAETTIFAAMQAVTPQRVGTVRKQIVAAVQARREAEAKKRRGEQSKDIANVELFLGEFDEETKTYKGCEVAARFFVAIGVNPVPVLNSIVYSPDEFARATRIPAEAKTGNLKGYKKTYEAAHFLYNGAKMENVLKTFIACSIVSSRYHLTIPRDVCERFLNSIPLNHVSQDLADTLESYRAKHMTGGAPTQTSQCTLQLATMRAAKIIKNGRRKDFALDLDSPVIESFAQLFGMTSDLEKARTYRASVEASA